MTREPQAYFLSWRTYGTWLHGDERGAVDHQHNGFGEPVLEASQVRQAHARARMKWPPLNLSAAMRVAIADVIAAHCRIRGWTLCEAAARTNHVHVVVEFTGLPPETMMDQFKAYATRALRTAGLVETRRPVWAEHGSTRYLWSDGDVREACSYVRDGQDVPH